MDEPSGFFLFSIRFWWNYVVEVVVHTENDIQQQGMDLGWLEQKILSGLYVFKINDCKFLVCQMSICFR